MIKGLKSLKRKTLKKGKKKYKTRKNTCRLKCRLYKNKVFQKYK